MRRLIYIVLGVLSMGSTCGRVFFGNGILKTDTQKLAPGKWFRDVRVAWDMPTDRDFPIEEKGAVYEYPFGIEVNTPDLLNSAVILRMTTDAPKSSDPPMQWPPVEEVVVTTPVDGRTTTTTRTPRFTQRQQLPTLKCRVDQTCAVPFRVEIEIGQGQDATATWSDFEIKTNLVGDGGGLSIDLGTWQQVVR